jgi:hypothetical protein
LLIVIFSVAFFFRVAVIFHNEYPPSSDIGLHSSILNLILDEETLPLQNPYHMGGEPLATPPGFHFFVSTIILFTGMPLLIAQLLTAAFFSSFIVFPAYLISKKIWRSSHAGTLAAFFAAVSALSLEMISWGGYTNIISLALLVLVFYIFLKDTKQPNNSNLLMGTLLLSGFILSHTFSLFVFFLILIFYLVFLFIGKGLKLKEIKLLKSLRFFIVTIIVGALLILPWLLRVLSFYTNASSDGVLFGGLEENKNLILANRSVDKIVLTLIIAVFPAFFMFKASRKRYADTGSLLLLAWFLVPVLLTQSQILGIFVDYSRFLYFIDFPGILLLSGGLFHIFRYSSIGINKISRIKWDWVKKIVPAIVFVASLYIAIVLSPWSIFPSEAIERVDFYTTIHRPEATGLEWIQNRTADSSVLVADHLYGWWLSGVGKRTTLSAAGLEFLLYSHEIEVAKSAQRLLDTDYYIDNGLIQVREDGPYFPRHNPLFSIETRSGKPYSLFQFQDNMTVLCYYQIDIQGQKELETNITLSDIKKIEASIISEDEKSTILTITRENDLFTVNKTLIVQRGVRFAELSYEIKTKNIQTNVSEIFFQIYTQEGNETIPPDLSMIGLYDPYQRVCGQAICSESIPTEITYKGVEDEPTRFEMLYKFSRKPYMKIKMLVGVFDAENLSFPEEVEETYRELSGTPMASVTSDPVITWDYHQMVAEYNVSFVVCRDYMVYPKFSQDPKFRLVFKGDNVAIFQVAK